MSETGSSLQSNLTSGSVIKNIIGFSMPYFLSYFMQTLYGMADLFITGQFNSTESITAVSVGSQVMHMLTVMIVGLAMGTTVSVGLAVGAHNSRKTTKIIGNTVVLFLSLSIVATFVLLLLVKPIVSLMSTPAEAVEGTIQYLSICFIGIPFITAYNIISSIFRGIGDSKRPMYFIAVACAANIVLDYFFIGVLRLGAAGAALGTTISQTISVIVALVVIAVQKTGIRPEKSSFRLEPEIIGGIVKIGLPVALQDGFIQISFIIITIIANQRGLTDAAAVGIVEKVIGFIFLVPSTMLSTVSTLSAQNIGAKKPKRAEQTLWYCMIICIVFGVIVASITEFSAESIVGIFDRSEGVIISGAQYIRSYVWDCVFAGMHFCFSGYFCANKKSGISFLHNVISIVFVRIPGAYFMSKLFADTLFPMGLAATAGSLLSVVICAIAFTVMKRKAKSALNNTIEQCQI